MAQWDCDLGADPMQSRRGVHIMGLDAGSCIIELAFVFASALFLNFEHVIIYVLFCKHKNSCNNSFIRAMYVMYYVQCRFY
jgi:hypothetical protein